MHCKRTPVSYIATRLLHCVNLKITHVAFASRENLGSRAEPTRIDVCTVRWAHAHAAVILQVCAEIRKNQPARGSDRNHNHGQISAVVVRDMQGNLCCENQSQ
jgi:hypothetical protein